MNQCYSLFLFNLFTQILFSQVFIPSDSKVCPCKIVADAYMHDLLDDRGGAFSM